MVTSIRHEAGVHVSDSCAGQWLNVHIVQCLYVVTKAHTLSVLKLPAIVSGSAHSRHMRASKPLLDSGDTAGCVLLMSEAG